MATRQIIGGNFQDVVGNPLNGGAVTFELNTDGQAGTIQVIAGVLTKALLDGSGNISGTINLWPNDQLIPTTTVYRIKAYTSAGQLAWESENVIPSGAGSFDLGGLIPLIY
jgi:hypothetical protein